MYKKLFLICIFVATTLTSTQFATADYTLKNSTTEIVWVVCAAWQPKQSWEEPAGWRTRGWYEIKPNATKALYTPQDGEWVYIYVKGDESGEIKPSDHVTRESTSFLIHPWKPFSVLQTAGGDFIKSNRAERSLEQAAFYKYRNGGSHNIVEPRLPDLPAQQIYDQAIHSVVWIHAGKFVGSGVLIDRRRKLVVTNQHVTDTTVWVDVFFPWRNQNGRVNKNADFYMRNKELLERERYLTKGKVIAQNVRTDLAIVQLVQIPTTAREIKHDFSRNVEDSMKQGDTIHILGNPGERLWNWTPGKFQRPYQVCEFADGTSLIGCLGMEGDTHGGNSGGPILNGQGTLIGILVGGTDETEALASRTWNIKALLNRVPANLVPISAPTYPKRVFRIRNNTGVTILYEIQWSNSDSWQQQSLMTGFIRTHPSKGQNIPSGYPKIRFDYIADDQVVTYRSYKLDTALFRENNNDHAPIYRFEYNQWGDELDLFKGAAPTIYPKRKFKIRNRTGVTMHYQIRWSNNDNWKWSSLETGFIRTHTSDGQNILSGYPKIRFDHIAGDTEVTYRVYNLESANANANVAPAYRFKYNQWGDRVDLYRDGFAAPTLSEAVPKETVLLSNYPNPFNPETWIPYQLSKPAEVTVTIYASDRKLVRTLALGHQPAGVYQSKSRAVYWDGKNELGEPVASGLYFYTLKAGDFTATRKMLIRK